MEHLCESPAMNKIEANDAEAQSADIVADKDVRRVYLGERFSL